MLVFKKKLYYFLKGFESCFSIFPVKTKEDILKEYNLPIFKSDNKTIEYDFRVVFSNIEKNINYNIKE